MSDPRIEPPLFYGTRELYLWQDQVFLQVIMMMEDSLKLESPKRRGGE